MSDSLRKRCGEFLEQYWLYRTHQPVEAQMTADDMLTFIESEINQARLDEAKLWAKEHRSAMVWHQIHDEAEADKVSGWPQARIAQLSSVQQEDKANER